MPTHPPDKTEGGIEIERSLTIWVHTPRLWHDLETAAGLPRHALGPFKTWNALGPKYFSSEGYDLDAMAAWAHRNGIPYTDERAIHYHGRTGHVGSTSNQHILHKTTTD